LDSLGNLHIYLTRKTPLHNEQGNVIGLAGISVDITKQKKLDVELRAAKNLLEEQKKITEIYLDSLLQHLPQQLYWIDKESRILYCNEIQAKLFRYSNAKAIFGQNIYDIAKKLGWKKEVADKIRANDIEVIQSAKSSIKEEVAFLPSGEKKFFISYKNPLFDKENNIIGIFGITIDITDRKQMEDALRLAKEKAEASNRAKSQFISVASHELRIPLSGILGMANFLHEGGLTREEEKEYVENILDAAKYQLSIVNNILDFSKLEADKFEIASMPVDLKALLEEVAAMLTAPAKNKGLSLLVVYEPEIPYQIVSDSRVLRQIFSNLINNSIKFTEQGHVAIRVHCLKQTEQSVQLEIAVEDTGIGIPADKLDLIFERFSQVADAYVRDNSRSGTGLGLSIVKKWIESMGGSIRVESELGKGSTFYCTFEFPLQKDTTPDLPWSLYSSNIKILVIDDTLRGEIICKHAGTKNCENITGDKALEAFFSAQQIEQPFDIVIMDAQLRSANPADLIHIIQQKSRKKPLSISLVSSGSLKEKNIALQQGFFATIVKPVQPIAFQTALTSLWEQWVELNQQKEK
jgi:two-component system aerobic respiration control sensor histidine kinase ArcB